MHFTKVHHILLLLSIYLLLPLSALTQNEANWWYFGNAAALNFNTMVGGLPTPTTNGKMDFFEANSTMSDKNGNLLFYTDGQVVFDVNHDTMPNGGNLLGHFSTAQCVIVPNPSNPNRYYIFHNDYADWSRYNGFAYTEVDMSLRGGLGDVIPATKNTILADTIAERMAAVKMKGRQGYWVIVHRHIENGQNSNAHLVYEVSTSGVNPIPQVFRLGPLLKFRGDYAGQMKVSPCGDKVASTFVDFGTVTLFDFDATTGALSNPRVDQNTSWGKRRRIYSCEFSKNGGFLYVSNSYTNSGYHFYQYNTFSTSNAQFVNTKITLQDTAIKYVRGMQRGPDGKIYFLHGEPAKMLRHMGVIHNPNLQGAACNISANGPVFQQPTYIWRAIGLPNFASGIFCPDPYIGSAKHCLGDTTHFWVEGDTSNVIKVEWDFANPNALPSTSTQYEDSVYYPSAGTFKVRLIIHRNYGGANTFQDTVFKEVTIRDVKTDLLGADTAICVGDTLKITSKVALDSYYWNTGNTTKTESITSSGKYWLSGQKEGCNLSDSIRVKSYSITSYTPIDSIILCGNTDTTIQIKNMQTAWSTGTNKNKEIFNQSGNYWVQIDSANCTLRDSFLVKAVGKPSWFELGNNLEVCIDSVVKIGFNDTDHSVLWSTGEEGLSIDIGEAGSYSANLKSEGCWYTDSIKVSYESCNCKMVVPNVFTPNGDGINDQFELSTNCEVLSFSMNVYNRWGNFVFSSNQWNTFWTGENHLPGVYFFVSEYQLANGKTEVVKGHVTLVRD